jgi:hypothetical protein
MPPVIHEGTYQAVVAALGLDRLSKEERIKALLTIPMDEFTAKLPPSVQPNAIIDGDLIAAGNTFATVMDPTSDTIPAKKWLKSLAVGDSAFDVRPCPSPKLFD